MCSVSRFLPHLLCLLSWEGQQETAGAALQQRSLTEADAAGPQRVHHLAASFIHVPQAQPHVPALAAPPTGQTQQATVTHTKQAKFMLLVSPHIHPAPPPPDEGLCHLQCADPDDRGPTVTVQNLLRSPGVQVPDVNGTFP